MSPFDGDSDEEELLHAVQAFLSEQRAEPAPWARDEETRAIEDRIKRDLRNEWPAQIVATLSDADLEAAGIDPIALRKLVCRAVGRNRAVGTEIIMTLSGGPWGQTQAVLWRGRTMDRGRRR